MTEQIQSKLETGKARLVAQPKVTEARTDTRRNQVEVDRNFELPTALFATTVGCYLGFLGVMLAAFGNPVLAIPMVIFAGFIFAGFGVPAIWVRLKGNASKPMTMDRFKIDGIMTNTGRCTARDASVQMLLLPVLVVVWGCIVALISVAVA